MREMNETRARLLREVPRLEDRPALIEGQERYFSKDYYEVYVPLGAVIPLSASKSESDIDPTDIQRNSRVRLEPACTLDVQERFRVEVDVNPALLEMADVSHIQMVSPLSGDQPHVYATFRKGADLSELEYLVRLRLVG